MMSSADGTKGRCPLDSRPSRGAPLRGERQGAALHPRLCGEHQRALPSGLPLGHKPQPPRCFASLPRLRAGRGLGVMNHWWCAAAHPAKRTAGWAVLCSINGKNTVNKEESRDVIMIRPDSLLPFQAICFQQGKSMKAPFFPAFYVHAGL